MWTKSHTHIHTIANLYQKQRAGPVGDMVWQLLMRFGFASIVPFLLTHTVYSLVQLPKAKEFPFKDCHLIYILLITLYFPIAINTIGFDTE